MSNNPLIRILSDHPRMRSLKRLEISGDGYSSERMGSFLSQLRPGGLRGLTDLAMTVNGCMSMGLVKALHCLSSLTSLSVKRYDDNEEVWGSS